MAFRIITNGKTYEADTADEFDALQERLESSNPRGSAAGVKNAGGASGAVWQVGRADAYFQTLKALAQGVICKLAVASDLKLTAADVAKKLKGGTHALGPAMKNIENVARTMKVAPPVTKVDLPGRRVLVLDESFRDALKTAGTL